MTHKDRALAEMRRVLKPGGKLLVLEFSRIAKPLAPAYDWYSFNILPWLGKKVAGDDESYRYLAESIRMHPDQATLADMLTEAGLSQVRYFNLSAGLVALHERSEEHTSELQSLMRISYAVFCLKKKK